MGMWAVSFPGFGDARPLSNIPLTWMLDKLEHCDVALPTGWRARFPVDADAPSVGTWRGWGKYFLARKKRVIGQDPSEAVHPTAVGRSRRAGEESGRGGNALRPPFPMPVPAPGPGHAPRRGSGRGCSACRNADVPTPPSINWLHRWAHSAVARSSVRPGRHARPCRRRGPCAWECGHRISSAIRLVPVQDWTGRMPGRIGAVIPALTQARSRNRKIGISLEEELGDGAAGAGVDLALQPVDVGIVVGRLGVPVGVSAHGDSNLPVLASASINSGASAKPSLCGLKTGLRPPEDRRAGQRCAKPRLRHNDRRWQGCLRGWRRRRSDGPRPSGPVFLPMVSTTSWVNSRVVPPAP